MWLDIAAQPFQDFSLVLTCFDKLSKCSVFSALHHGIFASSAKAHAWVAWISFRTLATKARAAFYMHFRGVMRQLSHR